jgi:hypothetical protein
MIQWESIYLTGTIHYVNFCIGNELKCDLHGSDSWTTYRLTLRYSSLVARIST